MVNNSLTVIGTTSGLIMGMLCVALPNWLMGVLFTMMSIVMVKGGGCSMAFKALMERPMPFAQIMVTEKLGL